jgi:hypothetical protein
MCLLRNELQAKFCDISWSNDLRRDFGNMVQGTILPLLRNFLADSRAAMENFIFLLAMLFNLRFKLQDALFRALDRSHTWLLKCTDLLGIDSLSARNFIIHSNVMLTQDFHSVFTQSSTYSTTAWLTAVEAIPDLSPNSHRDAFFRFTHNNYANNLASLASIQYLVGTAASTGTATQAGSPAVTTPAVAATPGPPSKPRRQLKGARGARTSNSLSNGASAATTHPHSPSNPAGGTPGPTPNLTSPPTRYCYFYLRDTGCAKSSCPFQHTVPPRGAPERAHIKRAFSSKGWSLSQAFLRDE